MLRHAFYYRYMYNSHIVYCTTQCATVNLAGLVCDTPRVRNHETLLHAVMRGRVMRGLSFEQARKQPSSSTVTPTVAADPRAAEAARGGRVLQARDRGRVPLRAGELADTV